MTFLNRICQVLLQFAQAGLAAVQAAVDAGVEGAPYDAAAGHEQHCIKCHAAIEGPQPKVAVKKDQQRA